MKEVHQRRIWIDGKGRSQETLPRHACIVAIAMRVDSPLNAGNSSQ